MYILDKEWIDDHLRNLSPESVNLWSDDMDENFTINFVLNKPEWRRSYEKLVHEFVDFEESLYIYPFDRLHMTLIGRLPREIKPHEIVDAVKREMVGNRFRFQVGYLQDSNASIGIIAEPMFELDKLRNNLRKELISNLDSMTRYDNIYEKLCWVNFIRFKKVPEYGFFETLWNMRNYQFGEYEAKDVNIYLNSSRTMDPKNCQLIEKITF